MQQPDLHQITAPSELVFDLHVADGSTLAIHEIVRVVVGKRLVCKAIWNGQQVYAKLFIDANAKRYAQRDQQGVTALVQASITTPELLYAGSFYQADTETGQVLLFKALVSAKNAEMLYHKLLESSHPQQAQNAARLHLMLQLTQIVARLHTTGLQQTDLHFKNFLIDAETVYAIDGDGIKSFSPLFKKRQKQRNLATFFSKLDALDNTRIDECYAHYCTLTGIEHSALDYANVYQLTQQLQQKAASNYADKKVFRTCTDVKVKQDFAQYAALSSDFANAYLSEGISTKHLDDSLSEQRDRLKSGNTCTVGKALIANQAVVIKRYNIKHFWHGLKLSVSQSRAAKSWANAFRLTILNIATAKPLALIELRFGWLKRRAYFLTEYLDAPDIAAFFSETQDITIKEKVAHETALLFYKLNSLQISHGDCKASNIKILDGKPVLIDLDSMQAHRGAWWFSSWWFEKKHIKDLKRFMKNWTDSPETSALFKQAFVQVYDEIEDYMATPILERAKIA